MEAYNRTKYSNMKSTYKLFIQYLKKWNILIYCWTLEDRDSFHQKSDEYWHNVPEYVMRTVIFNKLSSYSLPISIKVPEILSKKLIIAL